MSKTDQWTNEKDLDFRTKLGLRVLFLIFKVIAPYQFAHGFEKEIEAIQKQINEAE